MIDRKVDIHSRQAIKPSSLTPCHLRNFTLSLLDQLTPPFYGQTVFFYPATTTDGDCLYNVRERSHVLKTSLSGTLCQFYPMAGRIKDASSIDCNDEGAYFVEATINCKLSDFLSQPDVESLSHFLPTNDPKASELISAGGIVLVQLTAFNCGGTAIGICLSHKITDVSSLLTFLRSWTCISSGSGEALSPQFTAASLLPPKDVNFMPPVLHIPSGKFITKRFVFDSLEIAKLKAKATGVIVPSRVELVLAFILKRAVAASRAKTGSSRPLVLFQAVNLRKRLVPSLPDNAVGNLIWPVPIFIEDCSEIELHELTSKMRTEITKFCDEKLSKFKGDDAFVLITDSFKERRERFKDAEYYRCTSWCRFPLYETDYGWGRPAWVSSASLSVKNSTFVLLDTKDGKGIEAWVTLEEQEMSVFECDEELLSSALLNPSVLL